MKLLEVNNLSFRYKNSLSDTFCNINFQAEEGELILVCGATACGKTTLLKCLKPELAPYGEKNGEIFFGDNPLNEIDESVSASKIGYVMQRPENQTVTDRVRSELAFCGESLGQATSVIHKQVAETAAYFGMEHILDEKTAVLSGGQRQLLNLASVIAINPSLIILDEPTAQLDPIAAGEFIRTLYRITRELSVTVIIAEHRFEELLPLADKVLLLEKGREAVFDTPKNAAQKLAECLSIKPSLPVGLQVYSSDKKLRKINPPLTLGESRNMISECFKSDIKSIETKKRVLGDESAINIKNVYFTYDSRKSDVVKGASLSIKRGEAFSLLGSNGSGKSTLLSMIAGIEKPYKGTIEINEKTLKKYRNRELYHELLAVLPQDVQSSFLHDSVGEELDFTEDNRIYDFKQFYDMHPYDLSGGQQQLLGIKKLLTRNPKIILLDEPTKGLDGCWRNIIAKVIRDVRDAGMTIFIVTHDMELAAECSDRCGIFFDGAVTAVDSPENLFRDSIFYTTNAAKTARGIYSGVCTANQLIEICSSNGLKEDFS